MRKPRMLVWYWGRRGGGAWFAYEITRGLKALGAVEPVLSISRQSHLFAEFQALGLPTQAVDTYSCGASALAALPRLPAVRAAFRAFLREQRIDMVLCPMAHLWNPLMLGALRGLDLPYLLTVHDGMLHPGEQHRLRQFWLDWEIRRADGIVVLTDHVRRTIQERLRIAPERMAIAPHGPFTSLMTAETPARPLPAVPRTLMFFGRIVAYKGLDLLLDAYGRLRPRFPDLRLVVAGDGDLTPYRAALSAFPEIAVDNRYIAEEEVPAIVAGADLMVLPYKEASQSGVIALAEAAGIPVAATPAGGLTEQVHDGVTGVLARAMTGEALAEAIERLLTDPDLYQRCARGIVAQSQGRWTEAAERIQALALRILAERAEGSWAKTKAAGASPA